MQNNAQGAVIITHVAEGFVHLALSAKSKVVQQRLSEKFPLARKTLTLQPMI
jgi:hypothetical protein